MNRVFVGALTARAYLHRSKASHSKAVANLDAYVTA